MFHGGPRISLKRFRPVLTESNYEEWNSLSVRTASQRSQLRRQENTQRILHLLLGRSDRLFPGIDRNLRLPLKELECLRLWRGPAKLCRLASSGRTG